MTDFKSTKEYFTNIDFDVVQDCEVLDNVYKEIYGYEEKLILDLYSVTNFEILVKKSSLSQIKKLCEKINLHFIALKKTGSRFLEVVFTALAEQKSSEFTLEIYKSICNPILDNFKELCIDKNGTHVIRKVFDFLGKKFVKNLDLKNQIIEILEKEIEIDTVITIVQYLKLSFSKNICRLIIDKYANITNLVNKKYTYIFEDLIALSNAKSLRLFFLKTKEHFVRLINDRYGVFIALALIENYDKEIDFYYSCCNKEMKNLNVVLKIAEVFCRLKRFDKLKEILEIYYEIENNVFESLLLTNTETPDTKFINLVILFMEQDLFGVNLDFTKVYKDAWNYRKFGVKLLLGFFEGGALDELKMSFAKQMNFNGLGKKKDGRKIISLSRSYRRLKNR